MTATTPGHAKVPLIIPALLIAGSAVSILSTDLYVPSLPHLPAYFDTSAETVQLTMSLNLLCFAAAQLVHGPLSDRFGRRPVLLAGMAGFLIFTIVCGLAPSIEVLIAARALQGVMACAQAVVGLAIIRDLYSGPGSVRLLAAYGMAVAMAPAVGPLIGGHVHVWFGWRANFGLLALAVMVVTVLLWRYLPETTQPDREALAPRRLGRSYGALLSGRRYLGYSLVMAAAMGGLFAFITAGPFVFIDRLGVATNHYGLYQAVIVLAFFFGSLAANRGVNRIGIEALLRLGLSLMAAATLVPLMLLVLGLEHPATLTFGFALYTLGMGPLFATAPVRALDATPAARGAASAMLGTLQMAGAGLAALAVGVLHDGSAWPLAWTLLASGLLAAVIYGIARPWKS